MINYKNIKNIFFIAIIFALGIACEKEEGSGGTSDIVGKVWVQNYNADYTVLNEEYWAEEEDIYLIYGSDSIYSDRSRTNYDGSYWFKFLREGDYTVYAYSKDSSFTVPSGRIPVFVNVHVGSKTDTYKAPQINILD